MEVLSREVLQKIAALKPLLDDPEVHEMFRISAVLDVPANTTLFRQGDICENYLLVVEGSVKVFARSEQGREIVLYHIGSGGSCVLTTSCLFSRSPYPAEGVTETALQAIAIPAKVFDRVLSTSAVLRRFVFHSYGERLSRLISLVQQIAFERIDVRLARYLLRNADEHLSLTHQNIAEELGTAREVVSRHLKDFESQRWVKLGRGQISVINADGLRNRVDELLA